MRFLKTKAFLINSACLLAVFVLSVIFSNRSFIVGSLAGCFFLLCSFGKIKPSRKLITFLVVMIVAATTALAVFVKGDSTLGRVLIYKVSWKMFVDHPLDGIGWGAFGREYGLRQASYFQSGAFSRKEFLLADNVFYAFNDYWQFVVETGIAGGICLICVVTLITIRTLRRLRRNPDDTLLKSFVCITIVMCVAALFTHVLDHRVYGMLLMLSIAYIFLPYARTRRSHMQKNGFLLTCALLLCLFQHRNELLNYSSYKEFGRAKLSAETGYLREAKEMYAGLYPALNGDAYFLRAYCEVLSGENDTRKRLSLLQEIARRQTDNLIYLHLAYAFDGLGMRKEAEEAFLKSVYIVPNRFIPKQALYNFYLKGNESGKARFWRTVILSMPVKIPSDMVEQIKRNVKK